MQGDINSVCSDSKDGDFRDPVISGLDGKSGENQSCKCGSETNITSAIGLELLKCTPKTPNRSTCLNSMPVCENGALNVAPPSETGDDNKDNCNESRQNGHLNIDSICGDDYSYVDYIPGIFEENDSREYFYIERQAVLSGDRAATTFVMFYTEDVTSRDLFSPPPPEKDGVSVAVNSQPLEAVSEEPNGDVREPASPCLKNSSKRNKKNSRVSFSPTPEIAPDSENVDPEVTENGTDHHSDTDLNSNVKSKPLLSLNDATPLIQVTDHDNDSSEKPKSPSSPQLSPLGKWQKAIPKMANVVEAAMKKEKKEQLKTRRSSLPENRPTSGISLLSAIPGDESPKGDLSPGTVRKIRRRGSTSIHRRRSLQVPIKDEHTYDPLEFLGMTLPDSTLNKMKSSPIKTTHVASCCSGLIAGVMIAILLKVWLILLPFVLKDRTLKRWFLSAE